VIKQLVTVTNEVKTMIRQTAPPFNPDFAPPSHLMFRRIILWIHSHIKTLGMTWEALYTGKGRPDSLSRILHEILPENYLYSIFQLVTI